jgi:putative ABC transport system substrate-binding protein
MARDVVASRPDVIFAGDFWIGRALRTWTSEIPIVVAGGGLVAGRLVNSLSRPGRNLTGVSIEDWSELIAKRIDLLHELVPSATSAAFLSVSGDFQLATDSWRQLGLAFVGMDVDHFATPPEYRNVFAAAATKGAGPLVVADLIGNYAHRALIVELAAQHRLPAIFPTRDSVEIGGLMSYGVDYSEWGRLSAGYVVRVLRGEKPAEIPVYVIDTFELVINLKTARALGLTIPPAILTRADEVIE